MKVYGNKPPEKHDIYLKAQRTEKADPVSGRSGSGRATASDRVDLSDKAKEIADLRNTINQMPEVRSEKVQAIKKAVDEGTYKVDSRKVAGRLIDEII